MERIETPPGNSLFKCGAFNRFKFAVKAGMNKKHSLVDLLSEFLDGKTKIEYPELEVTILQLDPLRITDDFKFYMELSSNL